MTDSPERAALRALVEASARCHACESAATFEGIGSGRLFCEDHAPHDSNSNVVELNVRDAILAAQRALAEQPAATRELDEAEVERLAKIARESWFATPWSGSGETSDGWRQVVRAVLRASGRPNAGLRAAVREVVGEMRARPRWAAVEVGQWASRLSAALEASGSGETVPTASFPIWVPAIMSMPGSWWLATRNNTRHAFVTKEECHAWTEKNAAGWADKPINGSTQHIPAPSPHVLILHGPACQLHDTCRERPDLGLACAAGRANSTLLVSEATDPHAPSSTSTEELDADTLAAVRAIGRGV